MYFANDDDDPEQIIQKIQIGIQENPLENEKEEEKNQTFSSCNF